jgi:hypothetical protein
MALTRLIMQDRIRNFFQNNTYYSGDDLNNSIQDGLDEVASLAGCVFASGTLTFTANTTYYDLVSLFPNYVGLIAIFNNTIKRWMTPVSIKKLDGFRIDWEVVGGTPWYFCPMNWRYFAIYQKPLVGNYGEAYVFYYAAAPNPLTDTTVIPIPDDHVQVLENYCLTDLLEQQQEFTKASAMFKAYVARLEQFRLLMKNKRSSDRIPGLK